MWIFAGGVLLFIGLMGISSPAYWAFLAANCAPSLPKLSAKPFELTFCS